MIPSAGMTACESAGRADPSALWPAEVSMDCGCLFEAFTPTRISLMRIKRPALRGHLFVCKGQETFCRLTWNGSSCSVGTGNTGGSGKVQCHGFGSIHVSWPHRHKQTQPFYGTQFAVICKFGKNYLVNDCKMSSVICLQIYIDTPKNAFAFQTVRGLIMVWVDLLLCHSQLKYVDCWLRVVECTVIITKCLHRSLDKEDAERRRSS